MFCCGLVFWQDEGFQNGRLGSKSIIHTEPCGQVVQQKINILHNIKIYLEMCSCDWKLLRSCFGLLNVTVFLSVVMLETSRPPSLCNCLTLRQGQKLSLEGINPIFCTLLMLLTLVFQCTTFYSRWMPSTLFSFQTILVTQKVSVARLRP